MSIATLLLTGTAWAGGERTFWLPPQASTIAPDIDRIFYLIYWVNVVFFVAMMGAVFLFFFKYKQKSPDQKTSAIKGSHTLELIGAVIPTILSVVLFVTGFRVYVDSSVPPADSMDVRVVAQKWKWDFYYPEAGVTSDSLVVPAGENVRLTMSSKDVLHSFFVPDFRVKKDVLPNRYSVVWFNAPDAGEHNIFCTEYCGDGHSVMLNTVEVLEPAAYDAWLTEQVAAASAPRPGPGIELGELLYKEKACNGCHTADGSALVGPTFKGLYGKSEALEDGSTVTVDDDYLRESIEAPAAKIVKGYAPSMPPFEGQLTDEELNSLIDYIKTLE